MAASWFLSLELLSITACLATCQTLHQNSTSDSPNSNTDLVTTQVYTTDKPKPRSTSGCFVPSNYITESKEVYKPSEIFPLTCQCFDFSGQPECPEWSYPYLTRDAYVIQKYDRKNQSCESLLLISFPPESQVHEGKAVAYHLRCTGNGYQSPWFRFTVQVRSPSTVPWTTYGVSTLGVFIVVVALAVGYRIRKRAVAVPRRPVMYDTEQGTVSDEPPSYTHVMTREKSETTDRPPRYSQLKFSWRSYPETPPQ